MFFSPTLAIYHFENALPLVLLRFTLNSFWCEVVALTTFGYGDLYAIVFDDLSF